MLFFVFGAAMAILDIYVEKIDRGYRVDAICGGGSICDSKTHMPWFALFIKFDDEDSDDSDKSRKDELMKVLGAIDIVEIGRTPLLYNSVRYEASNMVKTYKVIMDRSSDVPQAARKATLLGHKAGVYNILYGVRASYDLDIKFVSNATPLILALDLDLEKISEEIHRIVRDIKIMSFDIEAHTEGSIFPRKGSPILSISSYIARVGDDVSDPSHVKDAVVLEASRVSAEGSKDLIEDFLNLVSRSSPDVIVGYNSISFDIEIINSHLKISRDYDHIDVGDRYYPHIDLLRVRENMGASLGIRSATAYSLDRVFAEIARDDPRLSRVIGSEIMEIQRSFDGTRISEIFASDRDYFRLYTSSDAFITFLIAQSWIPTLLFLSALSQIPLSSFNRISPGMIAEYTMIRYLEHVGFEPELVSRDYGFGRASSIDWASKVVPESDRKIFTLGKVYASSPGVFRDVVEMDFSQLYPSIMLIERIDPTSLIPLKVVRRTEDGYEVASNGEISGVRGFPVAVGGRSSRSGYVDVEKIFYISTSYGVLTYLFSRIHNLRKITKKLKNIAKQRGMYELAGLDQAVKIVNNSIYGVMGKTRGLVCSLAAAAIFWRSMQMFWQLVEELSKRYTVIYGDTDSVFISAPGKDPGEVAREVSEIVASRFGRGYSMELKGTYDMCIVPKQKRSSEPSRKSYICMKNGRISVIKGELYKLEAPDAIKEDLEGFYEKVIASCGDEECIENIFREMLRDRPIYSMFESKVVRLYDEEDGRAINPNKSMHYAAIALAVEAGIEGVSAFKERVGAVMRVSGKICGRALRERYSIRYMPASDPRSCVLMISTKPKIMIIKNAYAKPSGECIEFRYTYTYREPTREELIAMVIDHYRERFIKQIASKLIAAMRPAAKLDRYTENKEQEDYL